MNAYIDNSCRHMLECLSLEVFQDNEEDEITGIAKERGHDIATIKNIEDGVIPKGRGCNIPNCTPKILCN